MTSTGRGVQLNPDFPVLDSLRAVGALAVLTTHTSFQSGAYTEHGVWGILLARLDVGVAIFFVLSGFLLSRPYIARAALRLPPPATRRYYWKRAVRIYPVYAVTVVIGLAAIPDNDGTGLGGWVTTLLMADVYVDDELPHALTQMWSLAAEVAFYALLPVLMAAALGRRRASPRLARVGVVLALMAAISVVWHLVAADEVAARVSAMPATWLPAYLTWFAVGIALALAHVRSQAATEPSRWISHLISLGRLPGTCWALAAGALLVSATPLAGPTLLVVPTSAESLTKHVLYAAVGGFLVLTGVFHDPRSGYARLLSTPPLRHVGHISYSVFCIHLSVLYLAWEVTGYRMFAGHGLQIWVLTMVLSLIASELLYRFVEKPGMRLKDLGRRSASAATDPSIPAQATTTR